MKEVRNLDHDRLVCKVDVAEKAVVIEIKGFKTVVRFTADGRVEVENTRPSV